MWGGPARPDCGSRLHDCQQPVDGRGTVRCAGLYPRRRGGRDPGRAHRLPDLAQRTGTRARRVGQAPRRTSHRAQGRSCRPHQHRSRQDPLRGPGRGPGDDRHLRLRRRPVPPARRPHHALRTARTPAHGDVAPARRRRRHLGVQLSGRGVVLERGSGPRLRRRGGVETVREDSTGRHRDKCACCARRPRCRRARQPQRARAHRRRRRAAAARQSARSADQRDRFRTDGGSHRTAGRRALWPQHFGARR